MFDFLYEYWKRFQNKNMYIYSCVGHYPRLFVSPLPPEQHAVEVERIEIYKGVAFPQNIMSAKGLSFPQAFVLMRGYPLRRASWENPHEYIGRHDVYDAEDMWGLFAGIKEDEENFIRMVYPHLTRCPDVVETFSSQDILATDWEIFHFPKREQTK